MKQRLIDANKLAFELNDAQVEYDEFYKGLGKAKTIVENQPTVEPIKGKWIKTSTVDDNTITYKCSNCMSEYSFDYEMGASAEDFNYCPNCGADMREVDNEQN